MGRGASKKNKPEETAEVTLPVYTMEGKEAGTVVLDPVVFDGSINKDVLFQVTNAWRANQRQGLAATKTRGEVSGGGRKPWKQKGTGRARAGSTRSPLWRHGGVVFGPHPRDFTINVPQKIRALALKSSLNAKVREHNLIVMDELKVVQPRTKEVHKALVNLKLAGAGRDKNGGRALILVASSDRNLKLAARNIDFLDILPAGDAHCYAVCAHRKLVITREGLKVLSERMRATLCRGTAPCLPAGRHHAPAGDSAGGEVTK